MCCEAMVITVTLNPAVDKTIRMRHVALGEVNRVCESYLDPGGKGINVSRLVDRLGGPTIAFGFIGGEIGELIARALEAEGVQSHLIRVPGQTRLNVTIFDESTGQGTSFYDRGPEIGARYLDRLDEDVRVWLSLKPVIVLAGSLPPGVADTFYADYIALAHSVGVRTILDTAGDPLRLGIQARPYLIKPNRSEAEDLVGRPLPDLPSVVQAARELVARGPEVVVISLGAQGAICADRSTVWHAVPPIVGRRSTVGSGDSMVAGFALAIAHGDDIVEGLRLGTAAGAATAMTPGTALGSPTDIARLLPRVKVERVAATKAAAAAIRTASH